MKMTQKEIAEATTSVLTLYGNLVNQVQGTEESARKTVGAICIQFHDDGQYSYAFGGSFQKATSLGAIFDVLLSLRENIQSQQLTEEMGAFVEMLQLAPTQVN